jgi:hypothetical protein
VGNVISHERGGWSTKFKEQGLHFSFEGGIRRGYWVGGLLKLNRLWGCLLPQFPIQGGEQEILLDYRGMLPHEELGRQEPLPLPVLDYFERFHDQGLLLKFGVADVWLNFGIICEALGGSEIGRRIIFLDENFEIRRAIRILQIILSP